MQFQVPQFIDTEDKIVGPLSLRQFAYVGVAGLLSAILYFFVQVWLFLIGALILFGLAVALAFIKIEGRPFANVMVSAFNFYWHPQTYVWKPEHPAPAAVAPKIEHKVSGESAFENLLKISAPHRDRLVVVSRPEPPPSVPAAAVPITRETVSSGSALHRIWEAMQTGSKNSDKQFIEQRMEQRYQIFNQLSGDRNAARRVDYR